MNPGTQVTRLDDTLVKAIWAAAYRAGKEAGQREASAYEWGSKLKPETPEQAWQNHVQWMIEGWSNFDINTPEHWADVP